jgi:hypothetical protein
MNKNATKCNETLNKWCKNKHGASKIMDTLETYQPAAELQPIPLSWPFAQWGLDMVGKLHKSWPGGHVYMLVAVNKFTKWVEVALVTTQDSKAAINFINL